VNKQRLNHLAQLVSQQAKRYGDKPLYQFLNAENELAHCISFNELERQAMAWAQHLLQQGITPGQRALILMGHEPCYIISFWGCLLAGVVAVPVFPPKQQKTAELERLFAIVDDCQPSAILYSPAFASTVEHLRDRVADARCTFIDSSAVTAADSTAPFQAPELDDDHLAFLQYTSGSTGAPKGVMVSHSNLLANEQAIAEQFHASDNDVLVMWLPFYHDMGLIGGVIQVLYSGISSYLMSPMHFVQSPLSWLRNMSKYRATVMVAPNFAFDYCCEKISQEQLADIDLSNIRMAINGAEPVHPASMERFLHHCWSTGIKSHIFSPSYGLAEATLLVSCHPPDEALSTLSLSVKGLQQQRVTKPEDQQDHLSLAANGQVAKGHQICIVDPQTQAVCGEDQVGEIWVAGPSISRGYWNRDELNPQHFNLRLKGHDGRFMRTGDHGFLHEQALYITGREKELIILRGRNYYPQDIERGISDRVNGLQAGRIAAFAVAAQDASQDSAPSERLVVVLEPNRQTIKKQAFETLAQASALALNQSLGIQADEIIIARLGTITKTSSGKTQRTACKQRYQQQNIKAYCHWHKPTQQSTAENHHYRFESAADCGEFLRQEIASTANIAVALIATSMKISELGLDSIHIVELAKRVQHHSGVSLSIQQLMHDASIAQLAEALHQLMSQADVERTETEIQSKVSAQKSDEILTTAQSYQQQRLWFLHQLNPEQAHHNIVVEVVLEQGIDEQRLAHALNAVAQRHDVLRTSFHDIDGQPVQSIHPQAQVQFEVIECDAARYEQLKAQQQTHQFALNTAPLWKIYAVTVDNTAYMLVNFHHLIFDGVSAEIFCRELKHYYHDEQALPELAHQYHDYSQWQARQLNQNQAEQDLVFWRQQLGGSQNTSLSASVSQAINTAKQSLNVEPCVHQVVLAANLQEQIQRFARQQQLTPFMVLLGAFYLTLHQQTGQHDLTIGTDSANRPLLQWQQQLGFFVNQLALRHEVETEQSVRHYYQGLKTNLMQVYQHQHYPFDQLVSALNPPREGGRTPFFSCKLVWQRLDLQGDEARDKARNKSHIKDAKALAIDEMEILQSTVEFDLLMDFVATEKGLSGDIKFNPKALSLADVQQFSRLYLMALSAMVHSPESSLTQIKQRMTQEALQYLRQNQQNKSRIGKRARRGISRSA
jgi:acyl-CoA synthetase (AMP-forming)/AMP-acid ligase II/aryl carrier-like protein